MNDLIFNIVKDMPLEVLYDILRHELTEKENNDDPETDQHIAFTCSLVIAKRLSIDKGIESMEDLEKNLRNPFINLKNN